MSVIKYSLDDMELLEKKGKKLYKINSTLRDLANVSEHPQFKAFIDKYFATPHETESMILFIKMYQLLTKVKPELNGYQKITIIHEVMSNSDDRHNVIKEFNMWKNLTINDKLKIENGS